MTEMDWIEECKELQEGHFARDLYAQGWSGFDLCSTLDLPPPTSGWHMLLLRRKCSRENNLGTDGW